MLMNLTVRRPINELAEVVYRFWPDDRGSKITLVLDDYTVYERVSKRHKFRKTNSYSRLNRRDSNLSLADVPRDFTAVNEARLQLINAIDTTQAWVERK
jgi:hypothetical protein